MNDFISKFTELKNKELYGDNEDERAKQAEFLEINHIKLAIKLACLIRNLEFGSYFEKQWTEVERQRIEEYKKDVRDCRVVEVNGEWITKWKRKEEWFKDRQKIKTQEEIIMAEKYKIEIESIKQAVRVVLKQKFLTEFMRVKVAEIDLQNQTKKRTKKSSIDAKGVEYILEQLIQKAFDFVINAQRVVESELERLRQMKKADLLVEEQVNAGKTVSNDNNLANADRLLKAR